MRFKTRMMLTIGCVSLFAMCGPALSQPLPEPKPKIAQQHGTAHRAAKAKANRRREDRANRLVSMAVTHPPKAPAFGWPVLVTEARKYIGTNPTDRKRLWCATFMNMVLAKTGYAGTHSDAARSFARYGHRISEPKVGAIAVLTRGKTGGHVGVVSGIDANGNPIIISGNHGRTVGEAIYPRSRVIAYVMPSERREGTTQLAARGAPNRSASEATLDSPITELLAAIDAEQNRNERSRAKAARRAPPPVPHLTVQQAEAQASDRSDLPLEPGLAEFLGIKERSQSRPRAVAPPQREQRVEQQHHGRESNGRVADDTGLAAFLGLPLSR